MIGNEIGNGEPIAEIGAREAQFLAPDFREQPAIGMGGHAFDLVVGRHDPGGRSCLDGGGKRHQIVLAQVAFADVRRADIQAILRRAVDEMLERREHAVAPQRPHATLQAAHGRDRHLSGQIRILAEGFAGPPPARLAHQIDDGRENDRGPAETGLAACHCENLLDQIGIPCTGKRRRAGKHRRAFRHETVRRFRMDQHGNPEPRVFDMKTLDRVDEIDGFALIAPQGLRHAIGADRVLRHAEMADSVGQRLARLVGRKGAAGVEDRALFEPDAANLRGLFLERHPTQQIRHARRDRSAGIAIACAGLGKGRCGGDRHGRGEQCATGERRIAGHLGSCHDRRLGLKAYRADHARRPRRGIGAAASCWSCRVCPRRSRGRPAHRREVRPACRRCARR